MNGSEDLMAATSWMVGLLAALAAIAVSDAPRCSEVRAGALETEQQPSSCSADWGDPVWTLDRLSESAESRANQVSYRARLSGIRRGDAGDKPYAERSGLRPVDHYVAATYALLRTDAPLTPKLAYGRPEAQGRTRPGRPEISVERTTESNELREAIEHAGAITGVAPDYLWTVALAESGLRPEATTRTSSATGLFQFVEATWLRLVRDHGAQFGLGKAASLIHADRRGAPAVEDKGRRAQILDLRKDPAVASAMAAALTASDARLLREATGYTPTRAALYTTYVLGATDAGRLYSKIENGSEKPAAVEFPRAALANPGLFFERGRAVSLIELAMRLAARVAH